MKKIGALCLFTVVASAAFAQTNAPAARPMSLQDCFAAALNNNFDVRIERVNPQIAELNLSQAYGGYDPTFFFEGYRSRSENGGYINSDNQLILPTDSDQNNFNTSLQGLLPWGMGYNLGGNINDNWGHKSTGTNMFDYDSNDGSIGLTLTQPLLKNFWIDSTRLSIQTAKNQLKVSEQGLRQQIINIVTAVENAYYELIYARETVKVQQEALTLAETQLRDDKIRVKLGAIAESGGTLEQDEAQVAQSRAALISAQNTLSANQNTLKNLLTDSYAQWHDVTIEPTENLESVRQLFDVQDSWSKGMNLRPDLQQARLNLEQQGIQLKYYRNQLYPQLDLIGSYGFAGADREYSGTFDQINEGRNPSYRYGGQLTIPLSNTKARNQLKAGKATEKQILLRLKQLEQNVMVEIDNALKQAQSAWESVDATRQARIYAEAALDAEQKKYAVGKSTTFIVLQLQNNLTSARSQEIRALADYNKAIANLAAAEGTTLQRRNLDLQAK